MDYNDYTMAALVRQRHAELMAEARCQSLAQRHRRRRDLRAAVGAVLIRLGARLLREHYVTP
jgi:hypothetical protein